MENLSKIPEKSITNDAWSVPGRFRLQGAKKDAKREQKGDAAGRSLEAILAPFSIKNATFPTFGFNTATYRRPGTGQRHQKIVLGEV